MKISPTIFREYDIRGVVPDELDAEGVSAIAAAYAVFIRHHASVAVPRIILGRDARLSSPEFASAAGEAMAGAGAAVIDTGMTTTPMHYWIVGTERADAGLMITASHNPKAYNGFKFTESGVVPVAIGAHAAELQELIDHPPPASSAGSITMGDYMQAYVDFLTQGFSFRQLKIVIDASNGVAGPVLSEVFRRFPEITLVPLFFEPDGNFPNHAPAPLVEETSRILQKRVREERADLGAILDGDGDRIFFIDELGERVSGSAATALLAKHFLTESPGSAVVYNTASSRIVPETIRAAGGKPVRAKVGHGDIKPRMREHDAVFGGEHSGHFYFRKTFYAESSILALLLLIDLRLKMSRPITEMVAPFRRYASSGEINFPVQDWPGLAAVVKERYRDGQFDFKDGVTVEYPDWWFNVRPSNNEPLVRLNVEATTATMRDKKAAELSEIIRKF